MQGLPRAAWSNLLASAPMTVMGLASSATAVANANSQANSPDADAGTGAQAVGLNVYNGATFDRVRSANGASITTGTGLLGCAVMAWDGANYRRIVTSSDNDGCLAVSVFSSPGTQWDSTGSALTDAFSNAPSAGLAIAKVLPFIMGFNGTTWDRLRTNAAAVISGATQGFAGLVASPGEWSITHAPATNTQATISKAQGGAGVRHVARSLAITVGGTANSGAVTFNLRDGASGAGTILMTFVLYALANAGAVLTLSGMNVFGSANTAMTIETSAAPAANVQASVALSGYSTS